MWLYTRGSFSVRITRLSTPSGGATLIVDGPESELTGADFATLTGCMTYQDEIERTLMASGFRLSRVPDRRGSEAMQHGSAFKGAPLMRTTKLI